MLTDPSLAMTLEDACRLAWDYRVMRTLGARELLARSGYGDRWRSITVELLSDTLRQHPDWVDAWFQWSEDTRSSPRWYISECDDGAFDVGCHPTIPPVRYADRTEACAVFVRCELASIAGVGPLPE